MKAGGYGSRLRGRDDTGRVEASRSISETDTKAGNMTTLSPSGFLTIGAAELEYRMIGPAPDQAPTIVLLHEGLGCAGLWGDFPDRLQAATSAGVFAYSRAGSTTCMSRRSTCCQNCSTRSAFAAASWSGIPTARRSRQSMPAPIRTIG